MKSYGQFCPVAQTLEIVGERWTLLIVRELLCGSRRFSELHRGVPLMSRTMLSSRLKSLEDAGLVAREARGTGKNLDYVLTQAGKELKPIVVQFGEWGQRWARREVRSENMDAGLLMWDIRRNINMDALPGASTVAEFRFRGADRGKGHFWLILKGDDVDLCLTNPGQEVDLIIRTHIKTMTQVWMGDLQIAAALKSGKIKLDGPSKLQRAFPGWLGLSLFAAVPRPAA